MKIFSRVALATLLLTAFAATGTAMAQGPDHPHHVHHHRHHHRHHVHH